MRAKGKIKITAKKKFVFQGVVVVIAKGPLLQIKHKMVE